MFHDSFFLLCILLSHHKEKTTTDQRSDLTWVQPREPMGVLCLLTGAQVRVSSRNVSDWAALSSKKKHWIMGNNSQPKLPLWSPTPSQPHIFDLLATPKTTIREVGLLHGAKGRGSESLVSKEGPMTCSFFCEEERIDLILQRSHVDVHSCSDSGYHILPHSPNPSTWRQLK